MPTLRRGSVGGAVSTLQTALNRKGAKLAVDGEFGANTHAAVIAWQKKAKLMQDGIVGPLTWKSLGYR